MLVISNTPVTTGISVLRDKIDKIVGENIISGNNSSMINPNEWVNGLGALSFDINETISEKMFLNFSSGNQAITLENKLTVGHKYQISVKAKLISGIGGMALRLGSQFETVLHNNVIEFTPSNNDEVFVGEIIADTPNIWLGCILAMNNGSNFEIDDVIFYDLTEVSLKSIDARINSIESPKNRKIFNTNQFLSSLSKYDKPLIKIGLCGDSIFSNDIGGDIPEEFDEGSTKRPMRLNTNQISRRIYDLLSWNRATHRRVDNSDWIKSGTWDTITSSLFEGGQDVYHTSVDPNSYIEITIPSGNENFALICRRDVSLGNLNVTLNGGTISSYGPEQINLERERLTSGDIGNAFHTILYTGLPDGENVIRIAKENNTDEVQVWGGFYWSGNTIIVHNVAHGGHDLSELLTQHFQAEILENDFDAILFELPLMNEAGSGSISSAIYALETILEKIENKDIAFVSCHPFGSSPLSPTTNYYEIYNSPSMEDYNVELIKFLYNKNIPFIDVFSIFKTKIENRGGTLDTGEGGLWYTWDGQHQSEDGMREFWNIIKFVFENKPIRF